MDDCCPLCAGHWDKIDKRTYPCPCKYQLCSWCYNKLKETTGICPQCRKPYPDTVVYNSDSELSDGEQSTSTTKSFRKISISSGSCDDGDRDSSSARKSQHMRVIQRDLVYVIGLVPEIAKEEVLRKNEYFGQYGPIGKIVVNKKTTVTEKANSYCAYITFTRKEDALMCILCVDGFVLDGNLIRASFGTTKYCNYYVRGVACMNPDCLYLHAEAEPEDCFTKTEMKTHKLEFNRISHPGYGPNNTRVPNSPNIKLPPPYPKLPTSSQRSHRTFTHSTTTNPASEHLDDDELNPGASDSITISNSSSSSSTSVVEDASNLIQSSSNVNGGESSSSNYYVKTGRMSNDVRKLSIGSNANTRTSIASESDAQPNSGSSYSNSSRRSNDWNAESAGHNIMIRGTKSRVSGVKGIVSKEQSSSSKVHGSSNNHIDEGSSSSVNNARRVDMYDIRELVDRLLLSGSPYGCLVNPSFKRRSDVGYAPTASSYTIRMPFTDDEKSSFDVHSFNTSLSMMTFHSASFTNRPSSPRSDDHISSKSSYESMSSNSSETASVGEYEGQYMIIPSDSKTSEGSIGNDHHQQHHGNNINRTTQPEHGSMPKQFYSIFSNGSILSDASTTSSDRNAGYSIISRNNMDNDDESESNSTSSYMMRSKDVRNSNPSGSQADKVYRNNSSAHGSQSHYNNSSYGHNSNAISSSGSSSNSNNNSGNSGSSNYNSNHSMYNNYSYSSNNSSGTAHQQLSSSGSGNHLHEHESNVVNYGNHSGNSYLASGNSSSSSNSGNNSNNNNSIGSGVGASHSNNRHVQSNREKSSNKGNNYASASNINQDVSSSSSSLSSSTTTNSSTSASVNASNSISGGQSSQHAPNSNINVLGKSKSHKESETVIQVTAPNSSINLDVIDIFRGDTRKLKSNNRFNFIDNSDEDEDSSNSRGVSEVGDNVVSKPTRSRPGSGTNSNNNNSNMNGTNGQAQSVSDNRGQANRNSKKGKGR